MKRFVKKIGIILALGCSAASTSFACTDFRLSAQDGTVIIARSMEFSLDLHSNLMSSPRGRNMTTTTPNNKPGLAWKSKYGYVYLDALDTGFAIDGMNDQGLSVEALYLPGLTEYQSIPEGKDSQALPYLSFGDWVLGNFKTVAEVKEALPTIFVYGQPLPQANNTIFPLHFSLHDKTGKSLVVEFVAGKMNVYDNEIGVLTNSPTYDWQVTNIRNYLNLTPTTPKPVVENGVTFVATGQGSGMHGLPGDISPPSRFVKMAIMLKTVIEPMNAYAAVNTAQHIINNVDIPLGFVREAQDTNKTTNESTQWVVIKDLTHNMIYYRTYADTTLHSVDISKVNLAENAPQLKMPIVDQQYTLDMTSAFTTVKTVAAKK